jgi:hypothetical protein
MLYSDTYKISRPWNKVLFSVESGCDKKFLQNLFDVSMSGIRFFFRYVGF